VQLGGRSDADEHLMITRKEDAYDIEQDGHTTNTTHLYIRTTTHEHIQGTFFNIQLSLSHTYTTNGRRILILKLKEKTGGIAGGVHTLF
jgi:hypothetical protein